MSDESTAQVTQDNLSKHPIGKPFFFIDFFFKQSGAKKEVDRKRVVAAMGITFFLLLIFQVILEPEASPTPVGKSDISEPNGVVAVDGIEVPIISHQDLAKVSAARRGSSLKLSGPQVVTRPRDLKAIPPGTFLTAILRTGASNGLVKAESTENLRVNGDTFIEKGATFVGQGSSAEDRLTIAFNQVVFRDGSFGQVNAMACDNSDKIVGLKGSKVGNKALNIVGGLGLGFLGGFSTALQDRQGQAGVAIAEPSLKNALLSGTATSALQESQSLMAEVKNQPNIIEVSQNTPICILFGESR